MVWLKWLALALGALALIWAILFFLGQARWQTSTQTLVTRLQAVRANPAPARFDPRELEGLPEPVQRYFRKVLTPGQPMVAAMQVAHAGTFNMSAGAEQWSPFTSQQWVTTRRAGFVWDGTVSMLPGVPVRVHDAYVAGEGILKPAVLGLLTLADLHDMGGEVARGEFLRFLAEASWYPTALLPSQGARWTAVDDNAAQVTLSDGAMSAAMTLRFDAQGLVTSARAEARGRTVGKDVVMTPWEGQWSHYEQRDGMQVPTRGEVAWLTPEGRKPYWRGRVTSLRYQWAK
jgi:hypothetical protein